MKNLAKFVLDRFRSAPDPPASSQTTSSPRSRQDSFYSCAEEINKMEGNAKQCNEYTNNNTSNYAPVANSFTPGSGSELDPASSMKEEPGSQQAASEFSPAQHLSHLHLMDQASGAHSSQNGGGNSNGGGMLFDDWLTPSPSEYSLVQSPPPPIQHINGPQIQLENSTNTEQNIAPTTTTTTTTTECPPFVLSIIEQPIERCRFRYKAEHGPHGSLKGTAKKHKSCPRVKIEPQTYGCGLQNYAVKVTAQLYTNEHQPTEHVNALWGQNCDDGTCVVEANQDGIAEFPSLGIMRQKEKDVAEAVYNVLQRQYKQQGYDVHNDATLQQQIRDQAQANQAAMKQCLHSVRMGFRATLTDRQTGAKIYTNLALSDGIYNSQNAGFTELKIAEVDKTSGTVLGGDTLWLRCAAKVRREHIKVKFFETSTGWETDGIFSPNEVYEQILIILKTPPYHDPSIVDRRAVQLCLLRTPDNEYSEPIEFVYLPVDDGPARKRPRVTLPTFGPNTFGFDFDGSGVAQSNQYGPSGGNYDSGVREWNEYRPQGGGGAGDYAPSSQLNPTPQSHFDSSGGETMSLADLRKPEMMPKLEKMMSELWRYQLNALWMYSAEGDPKPMVAALRQLVAYQDPDEGNCVLHVAARNRQGFAIKTLLDSIDVLPTKASLINARNYKSQTALHVAVRYGDADSVHYLLAAGAERTLLDSDGNSVAHLLADTFSEDIYRDVLFPPENTIAGKQTLDLSIRNNQGFTPLHLAVKRLKLQLVETLLEAGAPLEVPDRSTGKTVLRLAVEGGDTEMVELLIQHQARVDCTLADGSQPLHVAVAHKHEPIVVKLVCAGANADVATAQWNVCGQTQDNDDADLIAGSSIAPVSPRNIAQIYDSERLIRLLNGEKLDPLLAPSQKYWTPPSTSGRSRARAIHFDTDSYVAAGPSRDLLNRNATGTGSREPTPCTSARADVFQDDLGALDFVTRIRLSKILDRDGKWELLAEQLGCDHMVEFIKVCTQADETSSPSVLLLDQYEQMPTARVSSLKSALENANFTDCLQLLTNAAKHEAKRSEDIDARPVSDQNSEDEAEKVEESEPTGSKQEPA